MKKYIGIFEHEDWNECYYIESDDIDSIKNYARGDDDNDFVCRIYCGELLNTIIKKGFGDNAIVEEKDEL